MNQSARTAEQIRAHYLIEKSLASQLKSASRSERTGLYTSLYDELFRRVPDHPQLTNRQSMDSRSGAAARHARFLRSLCQSDPVFLEVGAGDCLISLAMSEHARQVYAVDVSVEITRRDSQPANMEVRLSDGRSIPLEPESVDIAFSNQLMEHLHPEDATEQLGNVAAVLKRGGSYFIVTPNRMSGPHDVSQYFDSEATGFHLHEYRLSELVDLCKQCGFAKFRVYVGKDGMYLRVPMWLVGLGERIAGYLPRRARKFAPIRLLVGLRLLAIKHA